MLPIVQKYTKLCSSERKLLIVSEGFEMRSMSWLNELSADDVFEDAIICEYYPQKKSRYEEVLAKVTAHTQNPPMSLKYNRFEPMLFETEIRKVLLHANKYEDIYVDISVMSKLLIMIIINELKKYGRRLHLIYSEPEAWGPSKKQFDEAIGERKNGCAICLSSVGVGDIVRTPALSSVVMQKNPVVLVAGLSFNEQLVNILVNDINPAKIFLINQGCQRNVWREDAIEEIHRGILENYCSQEGMLTKFLLTEYDKVFDFLAKLYKKYWLTNRIVFAPTGYKMHAVSFALMKICCPDIHIEYPTPDSYLFEGFSSKEIYSIHELCFDGFEASIKQIYSSYRLGG